MPPKRSKLCAIFGGTIDHRRAVAAALCRRDFQGRISSIQHPDLVSRPSLTTKYLLREALPANLVNRCGSSAKFLSSARYSISAGRSRSAPGSLPACFHSRPRLPLLLLLGQPPASRCNHSSSPRQLPLLQSSRVRVQPPQPPVPGCGIQAIALPSIRRASPRRRTKDSCRQM